MGTGLRFAGTPYQSTKPKGQTKLKILIAHDNNVRIHTAKAHRLAKQLDKDPKIDVHYDEKYWKNNEKTSHAENVRREKAIVTKVDITIRLVPAPSKTGENRHAGAVREILQTIHQKKPIIQIFEPGARNSPYRTDKERFYGKKLDLYLKQGDSPTRAAYKGIKEIKNREEI